MYYLNPQQTNCGNGDITYKQTCAMPFNIQSKQQDDIVSYINNYLVSYTAKNSSKSWTINSAHPFVVSVGDFISKNYSVNAVNGTASIFC